MKKILLLIFISFSISIVAQKNPENTLGSWYMYGGTHKISDEFSLKTLAHFRFFDLGDDFQQLLIRTAGNYKISPKFNVTLGYAYFDTDATFGVEGGEVSESRIYEDFNVKYKTKKLGWAHRFRFEQRLLDIGLRNIFRYQLGLSHPINEKWSAYFFDEIHFNFSGKNFAQNWTGLGVKYKLSNALKLQLGYMKIFNPNADFDRLQLGIILNH